MRNIIIYFAEPLEGLRIWRDEVRKEHLYFLQTEKLCMATGSAINPKSGVWGKASVVLKFSAFTAPQMGVV